MNTTLVYLFEHPNWARECRRFGVDISRSQVRVELWDLSPILAPRSPVAKRDNRALPEGCRVVSTLRELAVALKQLDRASTLVVSLPGYQANTWVLYFLLSRFRLRYALSRTNVIPASNLSPSVAFWMRLWKLRPQKVATFILRYLPARLVGVGPARYLFLGGEKSALAGGHRALVDGSTERVWVHQLDYELYLGEEESPADLDLPDSFVVFLDEHMPYHWEFAARGWASPIGAEEYHAAMNRLFCRVEKLLGVPVIIAEHPSSDYATRGNPFNGRRLVGGQTVALIRRAQMVLAHCSTSLGYAALYGKPIMILDHPKFQGTEYAGILQSMANALGRPPVDFSTADESVIRQHLMVSSADLERYCREFIKKPGSSREPWGKVVAECALRVAAEGRS